MKNVKVIGWASILFLLIFTSCREDIIPMQEEIRTLEEPMIQVEGSVFGQVINENFEAVSNAVIRVNYANPAITDLQTVTDENGVFEIKNGALNANGTYITAEKSGYYLGAKVFSPSLGKKSYVAFQLLEKELTGSFQTDQGGEITTNGGAKVTFAANSIRYENGTAYTGNVNVYAKWMDPTGQLLAEQMPGDLRAWNADEELVQLATYGMMAVELEASNGAKLQISEGNTATLEMPVPAEILGGAPTTIPLWSFDEEKGYWNEESTATLQDGKYVGEVSHFSFWNCDAPFPVVKISGTVVDDEGNPIPYARLSITTENALTRGGWADENGFFCGKVPKNETMTISVLNNCHEEVGSTEIGPFSAETDLGNILGDDNIEATIISGTLVDCDDVAITDGYVFVTGWPYNTLIPVDEVTGEFSMNILRCNDVTLDIKGYDLENLLESDKVTVTIPPNGDDVDLGNLVVCTVITDVITVTVPDLGIEKTFVIYNLSGTPNGEDGVQFSAYQDSSGVSLVFDAEAPIIGSVPTFYAQYENFKPGEPNVYLYCANTCTDTNTELTVNDGPGGGLVGSYTGILQDELTENAYEVTIEFNLTY